MLKEIQFDTLHLVAKLTTKEMEEIYGLIDFEKDLGADYKKYLRGNKAYKHIIHCTNPFFMVFFQPRVGTGLWTSNHYNMLIQIQKDAIQKKPALLKLILDIGEWRVKRFDIAFDWTMPLSNHFMWINGNVKKKTFKENQNYYLYGERNECRAVLYDKKLQMKLKKGIDFPDEYLTRLEVRIRPNMKQQSGYLNDLQWLKKHMDKFVFIENVVKLSRSLIEQDKKAFRALRRNLKMDWTEYGGESARRRIREKSKEQSVDLFQILMDSGKVDTLC